jgi:ArsR family transcriptional regulator, arsenate/arsenite/antimonite-responsive transcriptional repressor
MAADPSDEFDEPYENIAVFSRALSHPARVKITELLSERGEMTCGEITDQIPLSQATVSQHLKLLRDCSMIHMEKDGLRSIYTLNSNRISDAHSFISALLNQLVNPL